MAGKGAKTGLICFTAMAFAAFAQLPPKAPEAEPKELVLKATTRLVQISVIVQNHHGDPVTDLKKEDFQIRDNGKPENITVFSVSSSSSTALPQPAQKLPPNIFTNSLEQRPGTPANVTIILLDAINTKWEDQSRARMQVVKYLQTINPEDRIGIYTLGNGLKVLHDYTTDSTDLIARLGKYRGQNLPDLSASEPNSMDADMVALNRWMSGGGGSGAERDFYMINRVNGTLKAIEFIANNLASVPGRKNLIWVSGGFPLDIGFDSLRAFSDPSRTQYVFNEEVDRCVRAVNNANLAIYPVDARGLMVDSRYSAEHQKIDLSPKLSPGVGVKNQQTMQELASRTGGRAYYNTNDLKKAIGDAVNDGRVVYTIGYYPSSEAFDGKFHKLDVKVVDRSGLNLRYRKGYFDTPEAPSDTKKAQVELRDAVWSPLEATGMALVVALKPDKANPAQLNVLIKIDPKGISLEPQGDKWAGRLDILLVQKNDQGKQFGGVDSTISLNLTRPNYDKLTKDGMIFTKAVAMDPQAKMLRVVVRDAPSGTLGSVTVPFNKITR
jgi:VWFA-related protein